jgi:protein-L-isoaspartate O-methyltransferase
MELWVGPWHGTFLTYEYTWARLYHPDGKLVLPGEESAEQRAMAAERERDTERQKADELAAKVAELEARLQQSQQAQN